MACPFCSTQLYIALAIVILAAIALLLFFANKSKKEKKLSFLAGIAFALIIAGIAFGDDRVIGYGLIGAGIAVAFIDIFMKLKATPSRKKKQ